MTFRDDLATELQTRPQLSLGISTVPVQPWEQPYQPKEALKKGTIFPGLYLPFFIGGENDARP